MSAPHQTGRLRLVDGGRNPLTTWAPCSVRPTIRDITGKPRMELFGTARFGVCIATGRAVGVQLQMTEGDFVGHSVITPLPSAKIVYVGSKPNFMLTCPDDGCDRMGWRPE